MFGHEQLTRCLEHKAALLQQSAAHRLALLKEAQNLRRASMWVDLGIAAAHKVRAGWTAVAFTLSFRRAREHSPSGFAHKLSGAISLARSLAAIWKNGR